jgi:diguanylate cyclase (GGDEF)-like protein
VIREREDGVTAPSIRTKLNWLVALSLSPTFGWGAILVLGDLHFSGRAWFADVPTSTALWWWLIASAIILVAGLAFAERLASQLTCSTDYLAASAARLADGLPVAARRLPIREAQQVSDALMRAGVLLNQRTDERDRAAVAAQRLRREYTALECQATHDALTGLVNRAEFDSQLAERLTACQRDRSPLAVLYIDVDGFKAINDRHGHAVGDDLLRLFAARLKAGVRDTDVVARLGGDEFAVLVDRAAQAFALQTAEGLIDRLSRPYRVAAGVLEVSASIGIAVYPSAGDCAGSLLEAADEAMYRAKRGGKGRYVTSGFTPL